MGVVDVLRYGSWVECSRRRLCQNERVFSIYDILPKTMVLGGTKACKHWLIPSILIWEREVGGTVVIEEVGDSRRKQKGSATREVSGRSSCHLLHSSLADVLVNAPVLMKSI